MTSPTATPHGRLLGAKALVPLLAAAMFINYIDRGNLATAAPLIGDELHLSSTQVGVLVSAFFWSYVPAQILAGWLAERINAYRTLALGFAIWSLATAASGLASGFASLLALRVILGFGESAVYPCSSKLLAAQVPLDRLGGANGLITTGNALGPAFGTFVGGLLIAQFGWRSVFILLGSGSLLWLAPWLVLTRRSSAHPEQRLTEAQPRFIEILRCPDIWGASFGQFCYAYGFYFVISWLPLYLVKSRGLSIGNMAMLGGMIYLAFAASTYGVGRLSDIWIRSGRGIGRVRKSLAVSGHLIIALSLVTTAVGDLTVSIAGLFCAGIAFGLTTPNMFAIGQTLAGPVAAGRWMGIQNCVANLAGIVAPIITGAVVDRSGQYYWAFIIAALVVTAGVAGWSIAIGPIQPIDWTAGRKAASLKSAPAL